MFDKSYFLVFVPGFTGSVLRDENADQTIWVDVSTIVSNFDSWLARMKFPENGISNLKATKVMDKIVIVNPLTRDEGYMRLWDMFEGFGMQADPAKHLEADLDVHAFPYDWRQDNVKSAEELKRQIEHWKTLHPGREVWIMAHSNGGVLARWYIEQLGGKDVVKKLILLGSPWDGTPKALQMAVSGSDFFVGNINLSVPAIKKMSRELFRTFPSLYQIMPLKNGCLTDASGKSIDCFDGATWLDNPQQKKYLAAGKAFTKKLGAANSVETVCLFGRDISTTVKGVVSMDAAGRWQDVKWATSFEGDGTIPIVSGSHEKAQILRGVPVLHTRFHLDGPAVERLAQVLGQEAAVKALLTTEHYKVMFKPNRTVYRAGEGIKLNARVTERDANKAVKQAKAVVEMEWAQEMPGDALPKRVPKPRRRRLAVEGNQLTGVLAAPKISGYYRLTATVSLPAFTSLLEGRSGTQEVQLHELIAVKA